MDTKVLCSPIGQGLMLTNWKNFSATHLVGWAGSNEQLMENTQEKPKYQLRGSNFDLPQKPLFQSELIASLRLRGAHLAA